MLSVEIVLHGDPNETRQLASKMMTKLQTLIKEGEDFVFNFEYIPDSYGEEEREGIE